MSEIHDPSLHILQFYLTAPYPCSYLENRQARSQVVAPGHLVNARAYASLLRIGFRRSGLFTYKPHCDSCQACISVRINASEFKANATQRRIFKRHHDLSANRVPMQWHEEHFQLYSRYQHQRHPGGGMDDQGKEQYEQFLLTSHVDTELIEFRSADGVLRMLSIIDVSDDGLSAVYTFYDPDYPGSLGTYGILWQIEQCRQLGLPWLYLGYWIRESPKMSYKTNFRPIQLYTNRQWVDYTPAQE
ncbi:MAG: arginyltransferase [Alcaligenaceae bacterium]|nr:arginyltransferase [Alcaligenaceae bacterium]